MNRAPSGRRIARSRGWFAVLAVASVLAGCTSGATSAPSGSTGPSGPTSSSGGSSSPSASVSSSATPLGAPVHVSSLEGDGTTWGVGMPLIVIFSKRPTSRAAFEKAATVTVNGQPAAGAWYWERIYATEAMEAHYRPQFYWPAHAHIQVNLPVKGLSAGTGLSYANDLSLDYRIGAKHVSRIDARTLQMRVYSDDKLVKTYPVSLGAAKTPTFQGIKVVMGKKNPQRMIGPGYNELVPWSVRVTLSGEFIHDAYWNSNIGNISTSNGCTNLHPSDSQWFYNFAQIGDVAEYPNATGAPMRPTDGYGDWNVDWTTWQSGGAVGP